MLTVGWRSTWMRSVGGCRPVIRKFSTTWRPVWPRFSGPGFHRRWWSLPFRWCRVQWLKWAIHRSSASCRPGRSGTRRPWMRRVPRASIPGTCTVRGRIVRSQACAAESLSSSGSTRRSCALSRCSWFFSAVCRCGFTSSCGSWSRRNLWIVSLRNLKICFEFYKWVEHSLWESVSASLSLFSVSSFLAGFENSPQFTATTQKESTRKRLSNNLE